MQIFEQAELDKFKEALEKASWENCKNDGFTVVRRELLGATKDVLPSGKTYTALDMGDLELCPECEGTRRMYNFARCVSKCTVCGGTDSVEAYEDDKWRARADRELASIEAKTSVEDGKVFVAQFRYKCELV